MDRLPGVLLLHQRNMLVGRGVEHDPGTVRRKRLGHARRVLDIADDAVQRDMRVLPGEFLLHAIERKLVVLKQHQLRRFEARDLPAQLRTDRSAGAEEDERLQRYHPQHRAHHVGDIELRYVGVEAQPVGEVLSDHGFGHVMAERHPVAVMHNQTVAAGMTFASAAQVSRMFTA